MTEQNAREAMEVLRSAVHAYGGELIPGENEDRAASVIAAKLAEKDAEIARLRQFIATTANQINIIGSPYHQAQLALDQIVSDLKNGCRQALTRKDA